MPNPLIENLQPASFRGIAFGVESSGMEGGRRVQVHEYPQRDKPYAEDLGRSTRRLEFDAFVVGEDYIDQADALLGALEESGSATLVHPWLGTLSVTVISYRVSFDRGLGQAKFALAFVESGELAFPSSQVSTAAASRQTASALETASVNEFASVFKTLGFINDVADQALTAYGKALRVLANPTWALSSALGFSSLPGNLSSLGALFGAPHSLGWNFAGLLDLSGKTKSGTIAKNDKTLIPAVRGLTRMASDAELAPVDIAAGIASQRQVLINQNAINASARQLLLVQAVGLASYLQCSVYDDVQAAKTELATALDAELLRVATDALYDALAAARVAMWRDLTERSRDSARLKTLTPAGVLPMLALAYDYYEDASRDIEIATRNRIRHPGFVPARGLLVVSR